MCIYSHIPHRMKCEVIYEKADDVFDMDVYGRFCGWNCYDECALSHGTQGLNLLWFIKKEYLLAIPKPDMLSFIRIWFYRLELFLFAVVLD